jgi:hypothetical protein
MTSRVKIRQPNLLIVEGSHDASFFKAAIRERIKLTDLQVEALGGKSLLRANLRVIIQDSAFPDLKALAIVRDADDSAASAFAAVVGDLKHANLPAPPTHGFVTQGEPRTGVYIYLPKRNGRGVSGIALCGLHTFAARIPLRG